MLRENNLAMLKALPGEAWEFYGMHQERGKETIAHVVRMFAGHDTNHLLQIERLVEQLKSTKSQSAKKKSAKKVAKKIAKKKKH